MIYLKGREFYPYRRVTYSSVSSPLDNFCLIDIKTVSDKNKKVSDSEIYFVAMFFLVPVEHHRYCSRLQNVWTVNKYTCQFLLCHRRIKFCCTRQVGVLAWCIVLLSLFERNVKLQWSVVLPTIFLFGVSRNRVLESSLKESATVNLFHFTYLVWAECGTSKPLLTVRLSVSGLVLSMSQCLLNGQANRGRPYGVLHQCLAYFSYSSCSVVTH